MRLGICGLGLIGSSVARAMVPHHDVYGLDPDPQAAAGAGALGVTMVSDTAAMGDCDLVLLAAPTSVNDALLRRLVPTGRDRPVADLGSVKEPILRTSRAVAQFPFVATHPMAGSEDAGVQAGAADLFRGGAWPVVIEPDTDPDALQLVMLLILALGARVVPVTAAAHDRAIAMVSHLPHLAAGALGTTVAADPRHTLAVGLAGGSFRDGTRVSGSPAARTAEFITMNSQQAAAAARTAAAELVRVADMLDHRDNEALAGWLEQARQVRSDYEALATAPQRTMPRPTAPGLHELLMGSRDSGFSVVAASVKTHTVVGGDS